MNIDYDKENNEELIEDAYTMGYLSYKERGIGLRCNDVGYDELTIKQKYLYDKVIENALREAQIQIFIEAGNDRELLSIMLDDEINIDRRID
jgi:hypothetical protein